MAAMLWFESRRLRVREGSGAARWAVCSSPASRFWASTSACRASAALPLAQHPNGVPPPRLRPATHRAMSEDVRAWEVAGRGHSTRVTSQGAKPLLLSAQHAVRGDNAGFQRRSAARSGLSVGRQQRGGGALQGGRGVQAGEFRG